MCKSVPQNDASRTWPCFRTGSELIGQPLTSQNPMTYTAWRAKGASQGLTWLAKNVKLGLLHKPRWNSRGGQYWPSLGRKELEACGKQLLKHPHIKSADPSGKTMPRKLGPSLEQDLKSLANLSQTIILL